MTGPDAPCPNARSSDRNPSGESVDAVRWGLDPGWVVRPAGGPDRFECSTPAGLGAVVATGYQLHLLLAFEPPAAPDEVQTRYPFEPEATAAFLARCRATGLLRPVGPDGQLQPAERVGVDPRGFGAPLHDPAAPTAFTLLGIPFDGNTTGLPGARFGPSAIRASVEGIRYGVDPVTHTPLGFWDFAAQRALLPGVSFADAGDVHVATGEDPVALYSRVTDVVRDLLATGTIPIVLGGDHSLTAPVLSAFPPQPLQVLHLDAHTDLGALERDDETRLHHGNVFSVVLDERPDLVRLVQVGLRGIIEAGHHAEPERVLGVGIDQLRAGGIASALAGLDPAIPTYVSIDIDVVDPSFAPSTGTPVPGGMLPHELKAILREAGARVPIAGIDVMEVARPHGPADGTAFIAAEAVLTLADALCERMMREPTSPGERR